MRRLTNAEWQTVQDNLTGEQGEPLRDLVFNLALGKPCDMNSDAARMLQQLGWFAGGRFTELGNFIKDPIREFGFWVRRNRMLPSEDCVPVLNRQRFAGKRVLELGSGGGCNLLSLDGIPAKLTGLEPMPVYLQLMPVLAEIAGLSKPEAIEATAENIPLADESYDVVLCYSSHQYMDVNRALKEAARVLAPGGELIIVGNTLYHFILESTLVFFKGFSLGRAKHDLVSILNTYYYQLFGRHIVRDRVGTTATPIYPSHRYMLGQLKENGIMFNRDQTCTVSSGETVLVGNKVNG